MGGIGFGVSGVKSTGGKRDAGGARFQHALVGIAGNERGVWEEWNRLGGDDH